MRTIDGTVTHGGREHDTARTPVCAEVNEWTPVLDGDVYCAPRCGFRCKKAEYDAAVAAADAVVRELGEGWSPRVWENMGWHSEVRRGSSTVRIDRRDGTFEAEFASIDKQYFAAGKTATNAVRCVLALAQDDLKTLERQIMNSGVVARAIIDPSNITDL